MCFAFIVLEKCVLPKLNKVLFPFAFPHTHRERIFLFLKKDLLVTLVDIDRLKFMINIRTMECDSSKLTNLKASQFNH